MGGLRTVMVQQDGAEPGEPAEMIAVPCKPTISLPSPQVHNCAMDVFWIIIITVTMLFAILSLYGFETPQKSTPRWALEPAIQVSEHGLSRFQPKLRIG